MRAIWHAMDCAIPRISSEYCQYRSRCTEKLWIAGRLRVAEGFPRTRSSMTKRELECTRVGQRDLSGQHVTRRKRGSSVVRVSKSYYLLGDTLEEKSPHDEIHVYCRIRERKRRAAGTVPIGRKFFYGTIIRYFLEYQSTLRQGAIPGWAKSSNLLLFCILTEKDLDLWKKIFFPKFLWKRVENSQKHWKITFKRNVQICARDKFKQL